MLSTFNYWLCDVHLWKIYYDKKIPNIIFIFEIKIGIHFFLATNLISYKELYLPGERIFNQLF